MKKLFSIFALFSLFSSLGIAFGYSQTDVDNANYLADLHIINKQTFASDYRLDANVSRYEVMVVALRLKGIDLTQSYECKGYYTDVKIGDKKCKVVELAAENGIISRANAKARPSDSVTRAETLKIIIAASGLSIQDIPGYDAEIGMPLFDGTADWQNNIITIAFFLDMKNNEQHLTYLPESGGLAKFSFYPNRKATRAEVFGFARNILKAKETIMSSEVQANF